MQRKQTPAADANERRTPDHKRILGEIAFREKRDEPRFDQLGIDHEHEHRVFGHDAHDQNPQTRIKEAVAPQALADDAVGRTDIAHGNVEQHPHHDERTHAVEQEQAHRAAADREIQRDAADHEHCSGSG